MSEDNEIELEHFFDERGVLMVRCKETKRIVSGLQSVSVASDVGSVGVRSVTVKFLEIS